MELNDALSRLGVSMPTEKVAAMIERVDVDGNRQLDFEEFAVFLDLLLNENDLR